MHVNWVTVVMAVITLWPLFAGARRGFAQESGYVLAQVISIAAALAAMIAGWWGPRKWRTSPKQRIRASCQGGAPR